MTAGFLPHSAIWVRRIAPLLPTSKDINLATTLDDQQTLKRVDGAHRVEAWRKVNEERREAVNSGREFTKEPTNVLYANVLPDDTSDAEMEMFALHINVLNDVYEPMNLPDLCYHVHCMGKRGMTLNQIADQLGGSLKTASTTMLGQYGNIYKQLSAVNAFDRFKAYGDLFGDLKFPFKRDFLLEADTRALMQTSYAVNSWMDEVVKAMRPEFDIQVGIPISELQIRVRNEAHRVLGADEVKLQRKKLGRDELKKSLQKWARRAQLREQIDHRISELGTGGVDDSKKSELLKAITVGKYDNPSRAPAFENQLKAAVVALFDQEETSALDVEGTEEGDNAVPEAPSSLAMGKQMRFDTGNSTADFCLKFREWAGDNFASLCITDPPWGV